MRSISRASRRSRCATLLGEGIADAELSISLVTEEEIAELHERYLHEAGPTDVLSFPLDEEAGEDGLRQLGDVVIAPAVAARNNPDDPAAELRLLLVHGILHLLGPRPHGAGGPGEHVGASRAVFGGAGQVTWLWVLVAVLVILGSVLAIAEASLTRMTRVRALALVEEGRRNAVVLERLEADPPRFLNAVYLTVMLCQNGSAIIVAILAERQFGGLGITLVSVGFTLLYFVIVEAMSKTFGVLHSDRAALAVAPLVWFLGRLLAAPTTGLISLANVLLPGKGLKQGPFVSEADLRSMAEVGHEEGSIEREEMELVHSIFEFGDTIVREVMVPRPDITAIESDKTLRDVQALVLQHGYSRIPVFTEDLDDVVGIVYAKDVLKALHQGKHDAPLADIVRMPHFVPESKKVADLLREMQKEKFHIALVTDEYGSVVGLITLEDLLEELVGEITDEYDTEEPELEQVADDVYRVDGKLSIDELNEILDVQLPDEEWDTVGGLMLGLMGEIPDEGEGVTFQNLRFTAERVNGRRISKILITREEQPEPTTEEQEVRAE